MPTQAEIVESLGNMPVIKLCELVHHLEEKWGVKAAPVPVQQGFAPEPPKPPEEPTEFSVVITAVGDKRIEVIKALRAVLNLGLAEAKTWVESISGPKSVKEGLNKKEALEIQAALVQAGAKVELQ
jgi:large subunit ribosomal protein L7/L12